MAVQGCPGLDSSGTKRKGINAETHLAFSDRERLYGRDYHQPPQNSRKDPGQEEIRSGVNRSVLSRRGGDMKYVAELLKKKGNDIWSVVPDTPVYQALQLMSDKNCGTVLVLKDEKLVDKCPVCKSPFII